jgi:hypothetical protein
MLDYAKTILMKVSFDARLFEKELMKALTWLVPMEKEALKEWCFAEYGHMYGALIKRCFIRVQAA